MPRALLSHCERLAQTAAAKNHQAPHHPAWTTELLNQQTSSQCKTYIRHFCGAHERRQNQQITYQSIQNIEPAHDWPSQPGQTRSINNTYHQSLSCSAKLSWATGFRRSANNGRSRDAEQGTTTKASVSHQTSLISRHHPPKTPHGISTHLLSERVPIGPVFHSSHT